MSKKNDQMVYLPIATELTALTPEEIQEVIEKNKFMEYVEQVKVLGMGESKKIIVEKTERTKNMTNEFKLDCVNNLKQFGIYTQIEFAIVAVKKWLIFRKQRNDLLFDNSK